MYAFRKPFTAATFEGLSLWGIDYKILLIISQVFGYTISKFLGIKIVTELHPDKRISLLCFLMGTAWLTLLFFAIIPYPYNFLLMFLNGLPLGIIWGVVFSFLEGRRFTEVLGAVMASSFIVSSGFVKAGGKMLLDNFAVSDFWMPFLTGLLFLPMLIIGIWMLKQIPAPTEEDQQYRTQRVPMNRTERLRFFRLFAPGIIMSILIYVGLTIFRDIRDNFAIELWTALGWGHVPGILALSEIPVAIGVLIIIGFMILIRNNRLAFYINLIIIFIGGILLIAITYLFVEKIISPLLWMIIIGFSMYLPYIAFHTMFYERWIALFRYKSNIGYLMYISDAFGYLGSAFILYFKNFGTKQISWLQFFTIKAYCVGTVTVILSFFSLLYFLSKEKNKEPQRQLM